MTEIISGLGLSTTFNLRKGGKGRQHFESKEIAHWNAHPDDLYLGSTLISGTGKTSEISKICGASR